MNILVCEDNVMTLRTIEFALKKAGYSVYKAENGDQGIRILAEEEIDMVITDINMPYTKGLELVRHINTQARTKNSSDCYKWYHQQGNQGTCPGIRGARIYNQAL